MSEKQEEVVPQFMVVPPNVLEEMKRNGTVGRIDGELQGRSIEQVKAGIAKERAYKAAQFEKEVEHVMEARPGWSRRRARRHVMRRWSKL
jgi:hypothetical protein